MSPNGFFATLTGIIFPFAGSTAPSGFLLCDGSAISRTTYSALFAKIGTTYGVGNGTTTFNIPDARGRVIVGKSTDTEFNTLGKTGGAKTHTLDATQIPSHYHSFTWASFSRRYNDTVYSETNNFDFSGGGEANNLTAQWTFNPNQKSGHGGAVGGGLAHNNIQPYITTNYIIKT